jgi:hypothetical protein
MPNLDSQSIQSTQYTTLSGEAVTLSENQGWTKYSVKCTSGTITVYGNFYVGSSFGTNGIILSEDDIFTDVCDSGKVFNGVQINASVGTGQLILSK